MLPAKLTPLEEFFLLEDCRAYPMTVLLRLRLVGRLAREHFQSAVDEVVGKHPLLHARIHVSGESRRWVDCPGWRCDVAWNKASGSTWEPTAHIDIRNEPATRITVVRQDEFDEVYVQAHHCCTDATGLIQFTEDVLVAYARRNGNPGEWDPAAEREIGFHRFSHRGWPIMPRWMFMMMLHRWKARTVDCLKIFRRKCTQLLPDQRSRCRESTTSPHPSLRILRFDRATTRKIIQASKAQSITVNTILLHDLFLAIRDWREQLGVNRENDMLRFCIPVNLRTERDQSLTIANAISLLFMDRNDEQMQSSDLLESVYHELHDDNRKDLRASFVTMLQIGRRLPGGLKRFLSNGSCWSTCLFSSLGVVLDDVSLPKKDGHLVAGNVQLEQWDLVPPMRDNLGLTVCPYTYAGRMSMVFHYDPTRINGSQLALMLQAYLRQLKTSIGLTEDELAQTNTVQSP